MVTNDLHNWVEILLFVLPKGDKTCFYFYFNDAALFQFDIKV